MNCTAAMPCRSVVTYAHRRVPISRPELKKHWTPSEAALRRLLEWLDAGMDSSGETYIDMRRRLSAYFERRLCDAPDDLADETLNRIARRLEEEGTLGAGPPGRYCYIAAKFVFLEYLRRVKRDAPVDIATDPRHLEAGLASPADVDRREKRLSCLDRCLGALPDADRDLILEYYGAGEKRAADRRRDLAARYELSTNALAIRACRIRDTLERCVRSCEEKD